MKRYGLVFIIIGLFAGSAAFTVSRSDVADPTRSLSLEDCLDRALDDRRTIRCIRRVMEANADEGSAGVVPTAGSSAPEARGANTQSEEKSKKQKKNKKQNKPKKDRPKKDRPKKDRPKKDKPKPNKPKPKPDKPNNPAPAPPANNPKPRSPSGGSGGKSLRFSIECDPGKIDQIDPLVSPGTLSAHLHNFFGNAGVTANRESVDAMQTRGTTCRFSKDTGAYWAPVLFDRDGNALPIKHVLVYYRHERKGEVDPHAPDTGIITPRFEWMCTDGDTFASPPDCRNRKNNPYGAGIRFIFEPTKLPNGAWTPRVAYNVRYGVEDLRGAFFHTGVAAHADFWNTWQQDAYTVLVDRCLDASGPWRTYSKAEWEARCSKVTDADFALGD